MNFNINNNYQSPKFSAKRIAPENIKKIPTVATGVCTGIAASSVAMQNDGMSANELGGRTLVNNRPKSKIFNQDVAYNYFANGMLKDVPEYIESGKKLVGSMSSSEKKAMLNTLNYQEQIVSKIVSEESLISNKNLINNLCYIVNYDYDSEIPKTNDEIQNKVNYFEEMAESQLKVLNAYAKNEKMQQNVHINERIADYVRAAKNDKMASVIIGLLQSNVENTDIMFFDNLKKLAVFKINPKLIKTIMENREIYCNLAPATLYDINRTDKHSSEKIINILNYYKDNYLESKNVTENLNEILYESFNEFQKSNPVEFAQNTMNYFYELETISNSDSANELCEKIDNKLKDIIQGKVDDTNKTDIANVNNRIYAIRDLRDIIKDAASKYTDEESKKSLSWMMGTIIYRLNEIKEAGKAIGRTYITNADRKDESINNEILNMIKN